MASVILASSPGPSHEEGPGDEAGVIQERTASCSRDIRKKTSFMAGKEYCPDNKDLSAGSDPSGYKYEFKDKIPEDLLCQRCKCVAREPHHTSCCGESFCKDCISPYHHDNQLCPYCKEANFNVMLDKRDQRKILALELYCPMKSRGCEWTGRLEQLEGHMDVQSGDCLYVDVECPSHCDQRVQKRNVQNHLSRECPLREYTCRHCNFKASYKVVSEDHLEVCPYFPVQCPNRCGVTCERQDLEDHMKICDKEELECCFSHAGCQGKFIREDEERHMEENTKKHLSLMATTMLKISKEMKKIIKEQEVKFQEKLQELEVKFQGKLQEQEVKFQEDLRGKEEEITTMKNEGLKDVSDQVAELQYNTGYVWQFPVTFTMPFFERLKAENGTWYSPLMYTGMGGYGFRIVVCPNGHINEGRDTHVSVLYKAEVGNYDEELKWPVAITVTLRLLNQHADKDHVTRKLTHTYDKTFCVANAIVPFKFKFISHKELDWDENKETQYLKNNCLQFKVVRVGTK